MAAILWNEVGAGCVLTLGTALSETNYLEAVRFLAEKAGIQPLASGSKEVVIVPRADSKGTVRAMGMVNISEEAQSVELQNGRTVTLGSLEWKVLKVREK
jgi:hypothetical protein